MNPFKVGEKVYCHPEGAAVEITAFGTDTRGDYVEVKLERGIRVRVHPANLRELDSGR